MTQIQAQTTTRRIPMNDSIQQVPLPIRERAKYAQQSVAKLSGAWTQKKPNLSGMRATFKRWRPDAEQTPTLGMRQYIWGWIGSAYGERLETKEQEATTANKEHAIREWKIDRDEEALVDEAATVVAMRAAAGDHEGKFSIGQALQKAGMSDLRLMRLLTSNKQHRLEDLHRSMRLIDSNKIGVSWTEKEVQNILEFLFGSDRAAQRAGNNWASAFFRLRGKKGKNADGKSNDSSSDKKTN